jgi:hypothetical protein
MPKDYGEFAVQPPSQRTGYLRRLLGSYKEVCDGVFPKWDGEELRKFLNTVSQEDQEDGVRSLAEDVLFQVDIYIERK